MQMLGDGVQQLTGSPAIKGIAAATAASPAPKVFCTAGGVETFSTRFALAWTDIDGVRRELAVGPVNYGRLRGPYKRRNVYGALLSYGPMLPADLRDPGMAYALGGEAPLLRELGVYAEKPDAEVIYRFVDGSTTTLRPPPEELP